MVSLVAASSIASAQSYKAEPQDATGKFLTATEVKQILPHTKAQWIAVRPYDGQDLLYFTNLLSWRCGLHEIQFAVNGAPMRVLEMEPCYAEEGAPNALKMEGGILPFVGMPLDSIQTIELEILYDDMSREAASFDRASVQIN